MTSPALGSFGVSIKSSLPRIKSLSAIFHFTRLGDVDWASDFLLGPTSVHPESLYRHFDHCSLRVHYYTCASNNLESAVGDDVQLELYLRRALREVRRNRLAGPDLLFVQST